MDKTTVIGHKKIREFLQNTKKQELLNHAYLLSGPVGIGKMVVVQEFIMLLLCEKGLACGQCQTCQQIINGNQADVWLVSKQADKQDITIEQIRQLHDFINLGSLSGGWRVVVIDGAQYLNDESGNALLKALEEPANKVIFFLLSSEPKKILATISSRCQVLNLGLVDKDEISEFLQAQGASRSSAEELAQLAGGRPGLAINLLQDPELLTKRFEQGGLFLELFNNQSFAKQVKYFENEFKETADASTSRQKARELINVWRVIARDLLCYKLKLKNYLHFSRFEDDYQKVTNKLNLRQLWQISQLLQLADKRLAANAHVRLTMEWAVYTIAQT